MNQDVRFLLKLGSACVLLAGGLIWLAGGVRPRAAESGRVRLDTQSREIRDFVSRTAPGSSIVSELKKFNVGGGVLRMADVRSANLYGHETTERWVFRFEDNQLVLVVRAGETIYPPQ